MSIRWSYAINQWNNGFAKFVLREEHVRAFRTISVCGFEAVEMMAGTGRWEPLGRKDWITLHYGSVQGLKDTLEACALPTVSSWTFDPGQMIFEESSFGRSVLDPKHHAGILATTVQYAELLRELGGSTLVARGLPDWYAGKELTREKAQTAGACWNAVGRMCAEHGVRLALDVDCVTMARTADDIALLLDACDPKLVGLALDTADATIAGMDPVALVQRFASRLWHVQLKNTRHTDTLGEYKLPYPAKSLLLGGGAREIERWYHELGDEQGLVDVVAVYRALLAHRYDGWVVVESDQSPMPPSSAMLNSWFVQNRLRPLG